MPNHNSTPVAGNERLQQTTLWTALITPFLPDESIDFTTLSQLAKEQESAGNGILLLGSTGEALAMTHDEQQEVIRHICSMSLSVPLMVGVGGFQLQQQMLWLDFLKDYPIDALLIPVPLYAKPGAASQLKWFNSLLDASSWPCMIYNVPSRTGVALDDQVLGLLAEHPNTWAVKEASGSVEAFSSYYTAAPSLQFFCGDDGLLVDFIAAGACGLVSVAANAWPEATARYVQQSLDLDNDPNQSEPDFKTLWQQAGSSLFCAANPIPVKALMKRQGRLNSAELRPPLYMEELQEITPLLDADTAINQWAESI